MTIRRTLLAAVVSGGLLITAGCAGDDVADDDADNDAPEAAATSRWRARASTKPRS